MSSKKLTGRQLQKFRSNVAKLKEKGLVSKRVDARKQRATRYMQEQVKKFDDVLSGKAKVIHTKKAKTAKGFADKYRVKNKAVVIPVKENESVSFSEKEESIRVRRRVKSGKVIERYIPSSSPSAAAKRAETDSAFDQRMRRAELRGKMFRIPIGNASWTVDTWDEMLRFMEPYEHSLNPYKNWRRYVEIVSVDGGDEE